MVLLHAGQVQRRERTHFLRSAYSTAVSSQPQAAHAELVHGTRCPQLASAVRAPRLSFAVPFLVWSKCTNQLTGGH